MSKYIQYKHHKANVWVDEQLQGKHRKYCLCWSCAKFDPEDRKKNCPIANKLFALDVEFNLVTPVFECPKFFQGYPGFVCDECATKYGGKMVPGHIATYSRMRCDICGNDRDCTEPRDFGHLPLWPKHDIIPSGGKGSKK